MIKQSDCQSFLEMQKESENFSLEEFKEMYKKWLKRVRMEIFVTGNTLKQEAIDIQNRIEQIIKANNMMVLSKELVREVRITRLPNNKKHFYEYLHDDVN